jgi:hypothetical protein
MSTGPQNAYDTIIVSKNKPEGEKEAEGFTPRNALPRSPTQPTTKPASPPEPNVTTPPTKHCTPDSISMAPRKKATKLSITAESLEATHTDDEGTSKPASKPTDTLTDQENSGINMEPNLENILKVMQSVHDVLLQNVVRSNEKADARNKLTWAIEHVKAMSIPTQSRPEENTCYKEIISELAEIKKAVKQTYAQAAQKAVTKVVAETTQTGKGLNACASGHKCGTDHAHATAQVKYEHDQARSEKAKKDIILTTREASDAMKEKIANIEEEAITKNLQELIQQNATTANVKIQSTRKLAKYAVRIRCHTENDAKQIKELNWNEILEGATVMNTEYGIVVHGVSKRLMANIEEFITNMERANHIKVRRVTLLRRNARNPDAPTQSIVIFMESPEDANKCIDNAVIIEKRIYGAQRYTPQCQIKQCFNCQAYGHKADTCIKKAICGKCAQEHETRKCASEEMKCANCKNAHLAWSHQCPKRKEISQNMETRRAEIPPSFPC